MSKHCLTAGVLLLMLFPACKKDLSGKSRSNSSLPAPFSISLTHEEADTLHAWIAAKKFKDPFEFGTMIKAIKSASGKKGTAEIPGTPAEALDDYSPSQDEVDMAAITMDYPSTSEGQNYTTGKKTIHTQFQQNLTFAIRGNSIQVIVPFMYDWGIDQNTGLNTISNIRASTPILLNPVGAYWGVINQLSAQYVNGGAGSSPWGRSAGISAFANAQETRTEIYSTTGQIKISTNVNLEAFQAGVELSGGFTISSAAYTYNQYNMNANGEIWIEPQTYGYNATPNTQFQGSCQVYDYGILKNQ